MITVQRRAEQAIRQRLTHVPAVMLVGARQVGKTSLARKIAAGRPSIIYDLEQGEDRKALANPGVELRRHPDKLMVIDEIQHKPELLQEIRTIIDDLRWEGRGDGKFLLLSSVGWELQKQSQSLTGRISELQLHPFDWLEIGSEQAAFAELAGNRFGGDQPMELLRFLWERGGHPASVREPDSRKSWQWRDEHLARTIAGDALLARSRVTESDYRQLLAALALSQGSPVSKERLSSILNRSYRTVSTMLSTLEQLMLIHRLPAYYYGIAQKVAKSPKYYICDSGIFHRLVNRDPAGLHGPEGDRIRGGSWEGFVVQNLIAAAPKFWRPAHFRSKSGKEIDLILQKPGGAIWAIEIRSGDDTSISRDFYRLIELLEPERSFWVHGGLFKCRSPVAVDIVSMEDMMHTLIAEDEFRFAPERQPAARPPESPELKGVVAGLQDGSPALNIMRDELVGYFLAQARKAALAASGPADRAAGNVWFQARNELLAWLDRESRMAPAGSGAVAWRPRLVAALEGVADLTTPSSGRDLSGPIRGEFARLCCYDAFVHVTAALLRSRCHFAAGRLLGSKYYAHGSMVDASFFWAAAAGAGDIPTPAEFVLADSHAGPAALIEADLLLLLNGMILAAGMPEGGGRAEPFFWQPWIFAGAKSRPALPLFTRAGEPEGMKNLLVSLALRPGRKQAARLKQDVGRYLETLAAGGRIDPAAAADIGKFLKHGSWHELA